LRNSLKQLTGTQFPARQKKAKCKIIKNFVDAAYVAMWQFQEKPPK
jgi:hypothetical protein